MMHSLLIGSVSSSSPKGGYSPAYPTTLQNPGAESGDVGWTFSGSAETSGAHAGTTPRTGSLMFWGGAGTSGSITQRVSVLGGDLTAIDGGSKALTVSFWHESASIHEVNLELEFFDILGTSLGTFSGSPHRETTWTLVETTRTLPVGTRSYDIGFSFVKVGGFSADVFVDDVSVAYTDIEPKVKTHKARHYAIIGQNPDTVSIRKTRQYVILET